MSVKTRKEKKERQAKRMYSAHQARYVRFQIAEVRWEPDQDDTLHPSVTIEKDDWAAILYCHPSEGWQVISLSLHLKKGKLVVLSEESSGLDAVEHEFERRLDGHAALLDEWLSTLDDDLHEHGRVGASMRWVGRRVRLQVTPLEIPE